MKRILLGLIVVLGLSAFAMNASAAVVSCTNGTITRTELRQPPYYVYQIDWTSDASGNVGGGSPCQLNIKGNVVWLWTGPGATTPTSYNVTCPYTINATVTLDVLGGEGASRSTTAAESVKLGDPMYVPGSCAFTVDTAGNAKTGTALIITYKEQ